MKVLVIDNDLIMSDVMVFTLRRAGFEVLIAHDGQQGYERWQCDQPDLVILDLHLPRMDGLTLCRRITQHHTPVIMLSELCTDEHIINGLEFGADDYIAKPFSPAQFVARVRAVLRRAGLKPSKGNLLAGDLALDVARRAVQTSSKPQAVQLTQLECRLLEELMLNKDDVMSISELIDRVWGIDGGDRVMLKQLIYRLRHKIEPDPANPIYLETIPGVGYSLKQGRKVLH